VEDPPAIQKEVREARSGHFRLDYMGFGLLALAFGSLEVVLDKGQEDDWFSSHFIVAFAVASATALIAVIFWELWLARKQQRPILDLYLFKNRTFALSVGMMFVLGAALYGINTLLPQLLQNLMGYTAELSGITMSTGGLATLLCMPLVGVLVGKFDPRKLIAFGFLLTALGLLYMSGLDLQMSMAYAAKLRFIQCLGIGFLFVPISTMAYVGVPADKNNDVSGMTNLARNIGGSCGTSYFTTILARHQQVHQRYLMQHANQGNVFYTLRFNALLQKQLAAGASQFAAQKHVLAQIYQSVQQQASLLSYLDIIYFFAVASFIMVPVSFLMARHKGGSVAMH
jgi:DHA2 family multidrug resistance protein